MLKQQAIKIEFTMQELSAVIDELGANPGSKIWDAGPARWAYNRMCEARASRVRELEEETRKESEG